MNAYFAFSHVHKYEAVFGYFVDILHFDQLYSSNLQSNDKLSK